MANTDLLVPKNILYIKMDTDSFSLKQLDEDPNLSDFGKVNIQNMEAGRKISRNYKRE